MSSIGTGYDLSASTYSPDGRIFQIEYANKAVENAGTVIGIRVKDGVILAAQKLLDSKLLVPGTAKRILTADMHVGLASAGLRADGKHLQTRAREECKNYRDNYMSPIPLKQLSDRLGSYLNAYTLYSSVRPFGISTLISSYDKNGPQLYAIEPSGLYWGYQATAVGKGKQLAQTELEKLNFDELSMRQAVFEAARIIHLIHDPTKDKGFELEISWVGKDSQYKHAHVPAQLYDEANEFGRTQAESGRMQE